MFSGISALSLDAKGRMTLPTRYRDALHRASEGQVALLESNDGCLLLMPFNQWSRRVERLTQASDPTSVSQDADQDMDWDDDTGQERRRFWLGLSDTPELDSAGRILINPVLRGGAGISREVMLLGVGSHFELWDPERLSRHKEQVRARKFRGGRD
jgi:MraZ protein